MESIVENSECSHTPPDSCNLLKLEAKRITISHLDKLPMMRPTEFATHCVLNWECKIILTLSKDLLSVRSAFVSPLAFSRINWGGHLVAYLVGVGD